MEDGRMIEVTIQTKGGTGKKRSKKNRNPWPRANLRKVVQLMIYISNKRKRNCREG